MSDKRYKQVLGGIKDTESNRLLKTPMGLMLQYADVFNNCIEWLNELQEEKEQYKERVKELEEENASMKGRILNAMVKSNQIECDCRSCVCEDYVTKELKK